MILKNIVIGAIKFYKKYKTRSYPVCKFYPSCSEYCMISIEKYGILNGSLKCFLRILRCNIFSKGGVDLP